jgi:diguanylate cyclase (GGDEF) domain
MLYTTDGINETQFINTLSLPFFSLVILCIIARRMFRTDDRGSYQSRLFLSLIWLNGLQLIADGLSVGLDGWEGRTAHVVLEILSIVDLGNLTVICYIWLRFVLEVTETNLFSGKVMRILLFVPALFSVVVLCITPFTEFAFTYTVGNRYVRTPGTYSIFAVSFLYVLAAYAIIIISREHIGSRIRNALLSFALPPGIAGVLLVLFPSLDLIWPSLTISLLVSYFAIQNEQIFIDHLTGVNNRRSLDLALKRKVYGPRTGIFGMLLIDLDKFKSINDTYGHLEGDKALEITAQILRKCFHHDDFIARYGGDEFIIIVDVQNESDLTRIERRLQSQVAAWNRTSGKPWKIQFSIGSISYPPYADITPETCMQEIDSLLYERKRAKYAHCP